MVSDFPIISDSYATHDLILEWNPVEKNRVNIRRRELKQFIVKAVTTSAINGTYLTGMAVSLFASTFLHCI